MPGAFQSRAMVMVSSGGVDRAVTCPADVQAPTEQLCGCIQRQIVGIAGDLSDVVAERGQDGIAIGRVDLGRCRIGLPHHFLSPFEEPMKRSSLKYSYRPARSFPGLYDAGSQRKLPVVNRMMAFGFPTQKTRAAKPANTIGVVPQRPTPAYRSRASARDRRWPENSCARNAARPESDETSVLRPEAVLRISWASHHLTNSGLPCRSRVSNSAKAGSPAQTSWVARNIATMRLATSAQPAP